MARYELRNMVKQTVMLSLTGSSERFPFVIDAATPSVTVLHPTEPDSKRFAVGLPSGASLTSAPASPTATWSRRRSSSTGRRRRAS
jgi:hypothetical protein